MVGILRLVRTGRCAATCRPEANCSAVFAVFRVGRGLLVTVFIDWLSISQDHADCPEWGSTRRVEFDLDTGELQSEVVRGEQVRGSWDSGLHVRSTGTRVEVSGNPSRFGRLDNLFGLTTLDACLEVYNAVLRGLGLPTFELKCVASTIGEHGGQRLRVGPVISQVHVTRNLILGAGGEGPFLDWMSAQTFGRLPYRRTHETTVKAGHVARRLHEFYAKGPEVRDHALKWRRARAAEKVAVKDEAVAYLERLAKWCEENGVVRDEVKLGRKLLPETGYRYPENWQDETPAQVHRVNGEVSTMNAGALSNYGTEVYEKLVAAGYSERQSRSMTNAVSGWLAGQDWDGGLSKSVRYRYVKALREVCGLDLRRPCNVRALATSIKPKVLEAREMDIADLPSWYRWPEPAQGVAA